MYIRKYLKNTENFLKYEEKKFLKNFIAHEAHIQMRRSIAGFIAKT